MRWTPILWILVSYAIFATSITEARRVQRDLTTIKKFVLSNILGSGRRKCVGKSTRRKPPKVNEVYVPPDRQHFILNAVSTNRKSKDIDTTKDNNDSIILSSVRQFLSSDILQAAYQGLRSIITMLQIQPEDRQEEHNVIDDVSLETIQHFSGDAMTINLEPLPVNNAKTTVVNYEIGYMRQPILLPSIMRFVSPIITMPRIYSYEQAKDDVVEKFTLDKNSDVIVTRTPNVPRPAFVEDRIKEVILNLPLSPPSGTQLVSSYIASENNNIIKESMLVPQISYTGSHKKEFRRSNQYNFLARNTNDIAAKQQLGDTGENEKSDVLHQHIDRLRSFEKYYTTSPFIQSQSDNTQTKVPPEYFYVPPNSLQGFTNLLNKDLDDVNKVNVQTRYTYKQQTRNGFLQYNNTSNVPVGKNGEDVVTKPADDSSSVYKGKPIVVGVIDTTSDVSNNLVPTYNNFYPIGSQPNNDKSRGDIPEFS